MRLFNTIMIKFIKKVLNMNWEENKVIYENDMDKLTVGHFLYGSCHLFALSLERVFKYKIACLLEFDEEKNKEYLIHAFCVHPKNKNLIIDAAGIRDKKEALSYYPNNFMETYEIEGVEAKNLILDWIKCGNLHQYGEDYLSISPDLTLIFENEEQIINDFIIDNKSSYAINGLKIKKKLK